MNPVERAIRQHLAPLTEASVERLIRELRHKWNEATTILNRQPHPRATQPEKEALRALKQQARIDQNNLHRRITELEQHQQNMGHR